MGMLVFSTGIPVEMLVFSTGILGLFHGNSRVPTHDFYTKGAFSTPLFVRNHGLPSDVTSKLPSNAENNLTNYTNNRIPIDKN